MKPMHSFLAASCLLTLATSGTVHAAPILKAAPESVAHEVVESTATAPQFQSGDRWCAVGDSITHTGYYTRFIYLFYATRFPYRAIDFFNCGSAGDTAKGTVYRLDTDILRHKPNVATIMLGMNDVRRGFYSSKFDTPDAQAQRDAAIDVHIASMRTLAERLHATGAKLIFITPSIFDDTSTMKNEKSSGVNAALGRCAENARKLAAEFNGGLVDFFSPMNELNQAKQKLDPEYSLVGPDRIHPKETGSFVMAYLFLKAQGVPRYVDDIMEDAAGKSEVEFVHMAKALPFPVPVECEEALKLVPFTEDMNQELLRVGGLSAGQYKLTIDDVLIRTFSADELQKGINLATLTNAPQYLQAKEVEKLDARRYELVQGLRTIDFYDRGLNPNYGTTKEFDWQAALAKRPVPADAWARKNRESYLNYKPRQAAVNEEKEALVREIRKASQPRPHRFRITRE